MWPILAMARRRRANLASSCVLACVASIGCLLAAPVVAQATTDSASSPSTLIARGQQLMEQGNTQEALQLFQQVAAADPRDGYALNQLGQALFRLGRTDEALGAFERSQAIEETAMNHLGIIQVLESRGENEKALQHGRRWTEIEPANPTGHAVVGRNLCELSRWDEAIAALTRANSLQDSAWGQLWLGYAYAGKKDYPQALAAYERSLAMPDDCNCATAARQGIALAHYALGKPDAAIEWLDRAIAGTADPGEKQSLSGLRALVMLSRGDYRQSAVDLADLHQIGVLNVQPVDQGMELGVLYTGGSADLAGLQSGDVLVEFAGKPLRGVTAREFYQWPEQSAIGDLVTVRLLRDGTTLTRRVVVGVTPDLAERTVRANAEFDQPALRIAAVKITPQTVSAGKPFSLEVAYTATDSAAGSGKAAVTMSFSILSGGAALLEVPEETVESTSGQPWKITKPLTAASTPGTYLIRVRLALGATVVSRDVEFEITR